MTDHSLTHGDLRAPSISIEHSGETGLRHYTLPPPKAAGIHADDWSSVSVSSALQYLQRAVDPTLAFALSCRRGLCNVCAMRIDGQVVTACTTPLRDGMHIAPARHTLVLQDTIVELSLVRKARLA